MKAKHWLIGGLAVLVAVGGSFVHPLRVESKKPVNKQAEASIASDAFSHDLFDRVLQQHIDSQGNVDYAALKENPQDLETYLDRLATFNPETLPYQAKLAFWINAYNALTIKGVIDHYPTTSVRKIKRFGGFFRRIKFRVGGKNYTLNDIEHGIIRTEFVEPRIHFVLVCASGGCPILENRAFIPETLEERLDNATSNFVRNSEKVRLDTENRVLYLSKIFEWYAEDFEDTHDSLLDFIVDYLPEADAKFLKRETVEVRYFDYDWGLNDQALKGSEN